MRPCFLSPLTPFFLASVFASHSDTSPLIRQYARRNLESGNHSRAPPQLNQGNFALCLSASNTSSRPTVLPDLELMRSEHDVKVDDGLLIYLALYAGQRLPAINETWQQPAYERWSSAFESEESMVVDYLVSTLSSSSSLSPRKLFRGAVKACKDASNRRLGEQSTTAGGFGPQGDLLCASVVSHNVLRALGRRSTYYDYSGNGVDYAPAWLAQGAGSFDEQYLLEDFAPRMQAAMLPLRNDGGGDGWGEWYHSFGLIAWGVHSAALFSTLLPSRSTAVAVGVALDEMVARVDTLVAVIVTPDHSPEDPVKARVDDDTAGVLAAVLTQRFNITDSRLIWKRTRRGSAEDQPGGELDDDDGEHDGVYYACHLEEAYVLPPPTVRGSPVRMV